MTRWDTVGLDAFALAGKLHFFFLKDQYLSLRFLAHLNGRDFLIHRLAWISNRCDGFTS